MTTPDLNMSLAVWSDIFNRLGAMMFVLAAAILYAHLLAKNTGRRPPRGVVVFGVLLILGSVYKLWGFVDYGYYRFMFQQLSGRALLLRYVGSVSLRLTGLAVATGVLMMKELSRKGFLALCVFTLCALYWKHPYYVFENVARQTEAQLFQRPVTEALSDPLRPLIVMYMNYAVDVIFYAAAFFYLTRPKVKELFQ